MFKKTYLTKRDMGLGFTAIGLFMTVGSLAVDWLRAGAYDGIGPAQQAAIMVGTAVLFVGLTLIPWGDKPA